MDKRRKERMSMRREMIEEVKRLMINNQRAEDSIFFYHPNEDHILLSHAIFLVMTKQLGPKLKWNKNFLLLRQYQEEMLTAYLTESEEYDDMLHFCNVLYEALPYSISYAQEDQKGSKACRKLIGIAIVAAGYAGDISEGMMYELLDDMDFHYNKVKCKKIEQLLPMLYDKADHQESNLKEN